MTKKLISSAAISVATLLLSTGSVLAHVVVTPTETTTATRQDFSVGVPNEKDIPTTAVRVVIPEGLESVTPYVKPGWEITTKTSGEGEEAKVTEITWSGGEIAKGLRDAFTFRAMTPSNDTTLAWKAYQTYSDGTVVSWDQKESAEGHAESEDETKGPQSETRILSDLPDKADTLAENLQFIRWVSYAALLLAAIGLALTLRKRSS